MTNQKNHSFDIETLMEEIKRVNNKNTNINEDYDKSTNDILQKRVDNLNKKFGEHSKEIKKVNKNLTILHGIIITVIIVLFISILGRMYEGYYRLNNIHRDFNEAKTNLNTKISIYEKENSDLKDELKNLKNDFEKNISKEVELQMLREFKNNLADSKGISE